MNRITVARPRCLRAILMGGVFLLCGACQDIDWNLEQSWWNPNARRVRPTRSTKGSDPVGTSFGQSSRPVPDRPTPTRSVPTRSARSTTTLEPDDVTPEPGELFRLELLSGSGDLRGDANVKRLELNHARASSLAITLEMLLPGIGRGGTEHRHYLLYESKTVWALASHFASLLDVDPVDPGTAGTDSAPSSPVRVYAAGVGMVHSLLGRGRSSPEAVLRAEAMLKAAAQSASAERPLRWASAMLAGKLLSAARFDRFDFDGAQKHFLIAQSHSEPTSFPNMVALAARAETLEQAGQAAEAQKLYLRVLNEYPNLTDAHLYRQVRRHLEESQKQ